MPTENGKPAKFIKSFEGHTHHVMGVGWTPDGKKIASCGADNFVKVWDYEKGEKIRDMQGHTKQVTTLFFVGKTPQFVTGSGDASVRMWNAENGGNVRTFAGADGLRLCCFREHRRHGRGERLRGRHRPRLQRRERFAGQGGIAAGRRTQEGRTEKGRTQKEVTALRAVRRTVAEVARLPTHATEVWRLPLRGCSYF